MGLGDILGSISPAYGLVSDQGLGSYLKYLSPAYDMFGGGGHSQPSTAAPCSVGVAGQQPLAQIAAPSLGDMSAALPSMSQSQNPLSMIGSSLSKNKGETPPLPPMQAYAPPQQPVDMSALMQLLGSIGQRR